MTLLWTFQVSSSQTRCEPRPILPRPCEGSGTKTSLHLEAFGLNTRTSSTNGFVPDWTPDSLWSGPSSSSHLGQIFLQLRRHVHVPIFCQVSYRLKKVSKTRLELLLHAAIVLLSSSRQLAITIRNSFPYRKPDETSDFPYRSVGAWPVAIRYPPSAQYRNQVGGVACWFAHGSIRGRQLT